MKAIVGTTFVGLVGIVLLGGLVGEGSRQRAAVVSEEDRSAKLAALDAEVRAIPASDLEANLRLYRELRSLDGSSERYQQKVAHYQSKLGQAVAAGRYDTFCRATIAAIMGRDPSIIGVDRRKGDVVALSYIRQNDGTRWAYRCKIDGNRVVWASDTGRWRTHPMDERINFRFGPSNLVITQVFPDGSRLQDAFSLRDL